MALESLLVGKKKQLGARAQNVMLTLTNSIKALAAAGASSFLFQSLSHHVFRDVYKFPQAFVRNHYRPWEDLFFGDGSQSISFYTFRRYLPGRLDPVPRQLPSETCDGGTHRMALPRGLGGGV